VFGYPDETLSLIFDILIMDNLYLPSVFVRLVTANDQGKMIIILWQKSGKSPSNCCGNVMSFS